MVRFLFAAAMVLVAHGALAQPGARPAPLSAGLAQTVPANNSVCLVGDSIMAAGVVANSNVITASGGTAPYTFSVAGLPTGASTITTTPSLWVQAGNAAPGTYAVTITATDNVAATGNRAFTLTISDNRTLTLVSAGASAGAVTVGDVNTVNVFDANRAPLFWLPFLSNRRVVSSQSLNFGVSGDTTTLLLARLSPVVAANCGSYVVLIGTNDLNNAGSPSLATVKANLTAIWTRLLATGRPVLAMTLLPRTLAVPANQAAMDMMWALNAWIRAQAGTLPGLRIVDSAPGFVDPTSATATPKTGATSDYTYTYDGLHPKGVGAYAAWSPLATVYAAMYPDPRPATTSNADLYSAANVTGNLLTNGMMSGTAGTVSGRFAGVTPDGWAGGSVDAGCSPCTFTATGSASTLSDGTPAVQVVMAGTANGGWATRAAVTQNITTFTNYAAGDKLQGACRVEMDANSAHITAPILLLNYTSGGVAYSLGSGPAAPQNFMVSDASPATAYSGTLATPLPAPALPGSLSGTLQFVVGVYVTNSGSATIGGTFRVGGCSLRKVV